MRKPTRIPSAAAAAVAFAVAAGAVTFLAAPPASAEIPKPSRKEIKNEFVGKTVYARIDLPHKSGRHAWGTYKAPLVEITPEGANTEAEEGFRASVFHADSTYWGTMPNSKLRVEDVDFDEDTVEVELEGVDNDEESTVVLFKQIGSVDDLRKAWEHAFSDRPLQDGHDDWPAEIKQAIAERRLVAGMNKRQAFYVVGRPESFEKTEEDGKEVEVWHTRQERGMKMGFWYSHSGSSVEIPSTLKFVDGALVGIETTKTDGLDLDG